jgi:imidazolonepropionase-like amidohydrolase
MTASPATLDSIIEAARANELWVAVHTGSLNEVKVAARAGATTIEHGVSAGRLIVRAGANDFDQIDAETLDLLLANGIIYVPRAGFFG